MKYPECGYEMQHQAWGGLIAVQGKSITVHAVIGNHCGECGEAVFDERKLRKIAERHPELVKELAEIR